ncbi:calcium-binding protein [Ruegeria sp. SCPT10]|uniref:calcium-binding protein n=1 Tax=Ruegeria sp. SCP10 TaxID=3141377 RepID=UPI00333985D4
MFLAGLIGLAAVGGAAYAMSDVLTSEEDERDEDEPQDNIADDISEGEFLEVGENVDPPATEDIPDISIGTVISEHLGDLVIAGTDGVDEINGQDGNDQINGYGDDDLINGGCGDDVLHGGDGQDVISGGHGEDTLHGEDGDDLLFGNQGDDLLAGHFGDDDLDGGAGDDTLYGGHGDDSLAGDKGDDALHGGYGDDRLTGGAGQDTLFGGDGDDLLLGRDDGGFDQTDFLNGGDGEDTIVAHTSDVANGGNGADDIVLSSEAEDVTIMGFEPGEDKLFITWEDQTNPDIQIEQNEDTPNLTRIVVDGEEVAQVFGAKGISLDDIQLITEAELAQYGSMG